MFCPVMVIVPEREIVSVFARNVAVTVPPVVPLAGDTLIQVGSLTEVVHDPSVQPIAVGATANVIDPPMAAIVATDVGAV